MEKDRHSLSEVYGTVHPDKKKGVRRVLAFLGPAYLVSVGYMDPGNWATDIAGGSAFGYKLIWVLLMSNLIAILLQSLCTRLGIVSGLDLAQASKRNYPDWVNFPLWILAEIAIAACDLAEIIGMAIGLNLVFGLPVIWGVCISAFDTVLFLFLLHRGIRVMEAFIISLVAIIGFSFLVEMLIVSPDYGQVAKGFIPSNLTGNALYIAIGIIGATVMPHNLYLHSSLVQTRKIEQSVQGKKKAIKMNLLDTVLALNMAFLVNAAILILAAAAFYSRGFFHIAELNDASVLLEKIFGKAAPLFFGIALIAAGQSSTVTGTLAGQIVMEGHINLRIQPWLRRLITRVVAIVPAILAIVFFGGDALGQLLVLSQVILSLQLGFAVIPLIHFTSSKKMMGELVAKVWVRILAWLCVAIILYLNIELIHQEIVGWLHSGAISPNVVYYFMAPFLAACAFLLFYIFIHPLVPHREKTKVYLPHGIAETFVAAAAHPNKHIGIAIDFSGKDQNIISNALKQGGHKAKYTFIHVVESAVARYLSANANDHETILDKENLSKYGELLTNEGFHTEARLGFGSPSSEITRIIKDENIDLLVMGAHGHKGIKDLIFGSTAEKVRHRIRIPILIVK